MQLGMTQTNQLLMATKSLLIMRKIDGKAFTNNKQDDFTFIINDTLKVILLQ